MQYIQFTEMGNDSLRGGVTHFILIDYVKTPRFGNKKRLTTCRCKKTSGSQLRQLPEHNHCYLT
jgi:hypothetical protein